MDQKINSSFLKLWDVICTIREQCPWDQKQTLHTLSAPFLEEAYEACEAVETGSASDITEELGDVFFMALMLMRIAQQEGFTSPEKIFDEASQKLISRHPHVYGKSGVQSTDEVLVQWEELKKKEKAHRDSAFDGIPKSLPSAMRLQKVLKKSNTLGWVPPLPAGSSAKDRLQALLLSLYSEGEDVSRLIDEIALGLEKDARARGL